MSLTSSFQIGRSALTASQLAIQVAGNNLANAATAGYHRQTAVLAPTRGDRGGGAVSIGRGVEVRAVQRQIDTALQARLWTGVSEDAAARQWLDTLSAVESTLNELSEYDLSSELSAFFNVWSEHAGLVQSGAVVVHQGDKLAAFLRRVREDLVQIRDQVDRQIAAGVTRADGLLTEIAGLNAAITRSEFAGTPAPALRDQRDALITELSGLIEVTAVEQATGAVDLLVGSTPILLGASSRGLEMERRTVDGEVEVRVRVRSSGEALAVQSGSIGALLGARSESAAETIDRLDAIAAELIFQVNRLHSTGTPPGGLTSTRGTLGFAAADRALALNDPQNSGTSGLPFQAGNGGFTVRVTDTASGVTRTTRIAVDLDGIDATMAAGFDDDTSVEDIRAAIDAVDGLTASFSADGRLVVEADDGVTFSFSDDTSGALAVLGMNAYFSGSHAGDIAIAEDLAADPSRLSGARFESDVLVDNGTSLAVAALQDRALSALNGESIPQHWTGVVQALGVRTDGARTTADAAALVRQGLEAQRSAVSGVSVDEESINLLTFQRQYQGAARFITVIDQLTQELIALV